MNTKNIVLSWLLHHANRYEKSKHFYLIKSRILKKYGALSGYGVQSIEGKKCYSCGGTGVWNGWHPGQRDICWHCSGGWYKRPEWNILHVYKFGKYRFYMPFERVYKKPDIPVKVEGYIEHKSSYWSHFARIIIFLLFDKKGWRIRWNTGLGLGWRYRMFYSPKNFINNVIHLVKNGSNSIPLRRYKQIKICSRSINTSVAEFDPDDLPF